jgi:hypothetical protein
VRRISNSQDRFEAAKTEVITVTITAKNTPHDVTFSDAQPAALADVQDPPPDESKRFTMPDSTESFAITYRFPPPAQRDPDAHYVLTLEGKDGTRDGPTPVRPLSAFDSITLSYEFVPAAG